MAAFGNMNEKFYICKRYSSKVNDMNTIKDVNRVEAYLNGILHAAYGVKVITGNVAEWQIDVVKKYAKKLKEEEIDHSMLTQTEKENQKRLWKQWIDETTHGFKDELKRAGRIVE